MASVGLGMITIATRMTVDPISWGKGVQVGVAAGGAMFVGGSIAMFFVIYFVDRLK
jgi:hypothetical protein